nr:MAG TPA: hypothetical protein [Caudoviricetes sp.]
MKTIKRDVSLTTKIRNNMNHIQDEFYSHDTNSAVIELTMDRTDLKKIVVLFHFQRSNRFLEVIGNVKGNVVEVPFDTSLITVDETVTGYVYIEKVVQSADVCKFSFGVRVSEIDKHKDLPVIEKDSKRIVAITEIVTKAELEEAIKNIHVEGATFDDSEILRRLQVLETKPEIDTSTFATKQELENKVERTEISHISAEIEALKSKTDKDTIYDDSALKQRVTALENKTDNDTVYNDAEIKQRLEVLEHKPSVNTSKLVTKQELESKGYLTEHQSLSNYATKQEIPQPYNDAELKERVSRLENKPAIDTSNFVTNDVLAGKGYLTEHQSLEGYAKKSEIPQPYNDTDVKQRLSVVEQKGKGYATKEQIESIPKTPQKLTLSGNTLILSDGGGSVNLPTSSQNASTSSSELTGTGMPNGKVEGTLGQTYVDTAKTNGALKWIKRTPSGNQGWAVLDGDTGWKTLNSASKLGNSYVKARRINDIVQLQFGGLQWGWFGIVRRGGLGFVAHPGNREKKVFILTNGQMPYGYRTATSLIGPIYNDDGVPYGTWYLGGYGDANHLRFQFLDLIPADKDIGDIRVSNISYFTDDPWPTN